MRATTIMAVAVLLFMVHRWATNQPPISAKEVVSGAFAIGVIALLDTGRTEEIARGFAWLFLFAAAYTALPAIAAAAGTQTGGTRTETASIKEA